MGRPQHNGMWRILYSPAGLIGVAWMRETPTTQAFSALSRRKAVDKSVSHTESPKARIAVKHVRTRRLRSQRWKVFEHSARKGGVTRH